MAPKAYKPAGDGTDGYRHPITGAIISAQELGDLARAARATDETPAKPKKPAAKKPRGFQKGFDPRRNTNRVNGRFAKKAAPPPVETLSQFANDLIGIAEAIPRGLKDVVEDNCSRVVELAQINVKRTAPIHNAGAWKGIDYQVYDESGDVWGEVGYNAKAYKPAHLGNLLEFGGGGDHSPAHHDLAHALRDNTNKYADDVGDFGEIMIETYWDANPGIKKSRQRWLKRR